MFCFLPLPDSFAAVLDSHNRLPLEYIPAHWLLTVCCNPKSGEYGFTTGKSLHRHWENSSAHHFSSLSRSIPPDAIQVACPNGTVMAIKITSYNEPKFSRTSSDVRSSCTPTSPHGGADTRRRAATK